MGPLKLMQRQLNGILRNNLCKPPDAWRYAPEDSTKKALDHSRALARKKRCVLKRITQLVIRMHWRLHRQRLPHFRHPHSSTRAVQR